MDKKNVLIITTDQNLLVIISIDGQKLSLIIDRF